MIEQDDYYKDDLYKQFLIILFRLCQHKNGPDYRTSYSCLAPRSAMISHYFSYQVNELETINENYTAKAWIHAD